MKRIPVRARAFVRFASFLAAAAVLPVAVSADDSGGKLSVSPIRITIDRANRAQTATVINGGGAPIDIAVDAYGWAQRAGVPLDLSESKNLLVYPRSLHIDAHSQRIVKVGIVDALSPIERTYRLSFTQIAAPTEDLSAPHAIEFRMRITMPVFVRPSVTMPVTSLLIEKATVEPHLIRVWLRNPGALHAVVTAVAVDATDIRGTQISQAEVAGWYVLAGAEQTFSAPSDVAHCLRIAHLNISVRTDAGTSITKGVVPESACAG